VISKDLEQIIFVITCNTGNMAGVKALILLAFAGCCGLLFLVLGCALPMYNNWWPLFVIIFYILAPIPLCISKRYQDDGSNSSAATEFALFLTTGIVVSAFGLPMILAHAPLVNPVISWGACGFVLVGNVITFITICAYFYVHREDDMTYGLF